MIFFVPHDLEICQMTLKNNRAPLLCYFKLSASFHRRLWIQIGVTVWKHPISKPAIFCPVWPWNLRDDLEKTIGHLSYATSSFMHHFIAIGEFKLELQPGNDQFGSKSAIFLSRVTLKFHGWLPKTLVHIFHATASFVHLFVAICKLKMELQSGNAQIRAKFVLTYGLDLWPLTLNFCMDITFLNGNNSWKFHDNTLTGTLYKRCNRQTD